MELKTTHNAGFFSCATIRLLDIMQFFNKHKELPTKVDSSSQFVFYKEFEHYDIVNEFYKETNIEIPYNGKMLISNESGEVTFSDYSKLRFEDVKPFIDKYFLPPKGIENKIDLYIRKYKIDLDNTCAVFYRGNDKKRECDLVPYQQFVEEAAKLDESVRFLVQPDETEFLEYFTSAFTNRCFYFDETPHMKKMNSAIFYQLPPKDKTEHGRNFLAAVHVMARCKHLITHSGNGGMWAVLYRGNFDNVKQFIVKEHIYK
jgi:hypothetical protein